MSGLRILVVEDDPFNAELLAELLGNLGHTVCASVATVANAVTAAEWFAPDLMIVDERLGDDSGTRAVGLILKHGHLPHLFATTSGDRVRTRFPDAVIVSKPFQGSDLVDGIRMAMTGTGLSVGT